MRCPGKEAIEAHFMSAVKEVITCMEYQTLQNSEALNFYR